MNKYFFLVFSAILVLFNIGGCEKTECNLTKPLDRNNYAEIDVEKDLLSLAQEDKHAVDFWNRMDQPNKLAQINKTDPVDVGLHFAGYPNIDDIPPDKVELYYSSTIDAIIIVLATNIGDDSVQDKEERIDLHFDGNEWKVEWAGYRQKCRRINNPDWVTGRCP